MKIPFLSTAFARFAKAYGEHRMRYRDFAKESRALDGYSEQELADGMDRAAFVMLRDLKDILMRLRYRAEFKFSGEDYFAHLDPFIKKLEHHVRFHYIDGHLGLNEEIAREARLKAGDVLDCFAEFEKEEGTLLPSLRRPFILALGYAAMCRDETQAIREQAIPTYRETRIARAAMSGQEQPRHYRGVRLDKE